MISSTKTVLYAAVHPSWREEYSSAARPALMLYFREKENVFEAEKEGK